ncbi:MAG: 2,3-cyclic 3-phosphodiesterase [Thermoplasmata archaeon]|nr:2,3-cyclic 3-phosphodiesterase [Thermoplasmata archaeon]
MRLFLGVQAPPSPQYARVTHFLRERAPGLRPVPPGSWHLTLRFLGEADPTAVVRAVAPVLQEAHSVPVVVQGVGAFPDPARARVVWAGAVAGGIEGLAMLLEAATPMRQDPNAGRPFSAHVTLGRLPQPVDLRRFCDDFRAAQFAEDWFDEVCLFASEQGPEGPRHRVLHRFPLTRLDPEDPGDGHDRRFPFERRRMMVQPGS